jgi:glycerol dehydrogenase-like iron-containing ADH family enzyme
MNDDQKKQALAAWQKLLNEPEIRMDAEEQYDELLKAADEMERTGLINSSEWRKLVKAAGTSFAKAIEGVGGGT